MKLAMPASLKSMLLIAIGLTLTAGIAAPAQDALPATRPGDPVFAVMRLHNRTELLDLPVDEKSRVDAYLDEAEQQAETIETEIQDDRPAVRIERTELFISQVRAHLAEILPAQQFERLHEPVAMGGVGGPTTQPERGPGAAFPALQRLRSALDQIDLSPDQKQQVADLLTQMQPKLQQLRRDRLAGQQVRQQVQSLLADFRTSLVDILTPDQREKLRQLVRADAPATRPAVVASDQPPAMMMEQPDAAEPEHIAAAPQPTVERAPKSATVGADAPPFKLQTPGGATIQLSRFKGRVLVLEFGSISSPTFRDRVAAMQRLQQTFTNRAFFLLVYTREAFPNGGHESARNQEDGISVDQPTDLRSRQVLADQARSSLGITMPVVADSMDDAASTAYGGFPNATVIIGRDGKIVGRQQWTDPSGLPRLIDLAVAAK
jgi:hypothetical protein